MPEARLPQTSTADRSGRDPFVGAFMQMRYRPPWTARGIEIFAMAERSQPEDGQRQLVVGDRRRRFQMLRLPTCVDADTSTAFAIVTLAYWLCTLSIRNSGSLIKTDNSISSGNSADHPSQLSQTSKGWI
jgi:hypothetical protein